MNYSAPVQVDVRDVEPRHRFDLIMGTYEALAPGDTMHLVVDHDPRCMYYTLRATRPEGSFAFDYIEHGPDVWRVLVSRTAP
jgi:uncharacterized protein (DUF2249 family)